MAISFDDIKKLSPKIKALIIAGIFIVLGYAYYSLFLQTALETASKLSAKNEKLAAEVTEKERIVAQKPKYLQEVAALKVAFNMALQKLPNKREIPNLLDAVVMAGKRAGIEFLIFEPAPATKKVLPPPKTGVRENLKPSDQRAEQKTEQKVETAKASPPESEEPEKFYDEIPIKVTINGGFHNLLVFFYSIGNLPRIINIEDVSVGDAKEVKGRGYIVNTSCLIKTYMFVDKSQ